MKVRDLGKAILDFELNTIPDIFKTAFFAIFTFCYKGLRQLLKLYIAALPLAVLASIAIFFLGLETCSEYCYGVIKLRDDLYLDDDHLSAIIGITISYVVCYFFYRKL